MSAPEFSHVVPLDRIGEGGRDERFVADEAQRAALARRFGWVAVERLDGEARLRKVAGGVAAVGHVSARIMQSCTVTNEPVAEDIDAPFDLRFVDALREADDEVELADDDLDTLPIEGGAIDIGEAAAQTVALAADPFPRAPGAGSGDASAGPSGHPFADLKGLLDR